MTRRHTGIEPLAISVEECAEALGLSRAKIYLLMDTEGLPSVKFGKSRRIPVDSLREWLRARARDQEDQALRLAPMKIQPAPPVAANFTRGRSRGNV